MATHSSILAWEIPWTEDAGGYNVWGRKESDVTEQLSTASCLMKLLTDIHGRLSSGASVWLMQSVHPGWSVSADFLNCIVTSG